MCLNDGRNASAFHQRKLSLGTVVTAEFASHVQTYVDRVREFATGKVLLVEQRIPFGDRIGVEEQFGTADAVVFDTEQDELQVHDLKFGRGVRVDADNNEQLLLYALGAVNQFDEVHPWQRVRLVIHQPRIDHLSEWTCSIEDLNSFAAVAHEAAARALAEDAPLNPGEKQCRFCRAKSTCPAIAATVKEVVFEDLEAVSSVPEEPEALGRLMALVPMIEDWCRAVSAKVESELLAGKKIEGWKLVEGRKGTRAWGNPEEVESVLKSMRLKNEEMFEFKLISPTSAEKLFKDHPRRWSRLQEHIRQSDGRPSVAPANDRRREIVVQPVTEKFEVLA